MRRAFLVMAICLSLMVVCSNANAIDLYLGDGSINNDQPTEGTSIIPAITTIGGVTFKGYYNNLSNNAYALTRNYYGLGVRSVSGDNSYNIDGLNADDILAIYFPSQVNLTGLYFGYGNGTEDFRLFAGNFDATPDLVGDVPNSPFTKYALNVTNNVFYLQATGINDDFRLKRIEYSPVPEPSALILLGFGLLGLAAARRKLAK